jgi:hypothetical protein
MKGAIKVIIRIMGEGQYHVPEALCDQLKEVDNRIVVLVEKGNEKEFREELLKLISEIRKKGKVVEEKEILVSDIIVPPENMSFKEVKDIFKESEI